MEEIINIIIQRRRNGEEIDHNVVHGLVLHNIFQPHIRNIRVQFDLNSLDDKTVKQLFRFLRADMIRLVLLLRIPLQIRTQSRYHAPGLEALCIFLRRLAYPNRLCELELLFNRGSSALSEIANFVSGHINEHFSQLLQNLNALQWLNRNKLDFYSQAVTARGGAVPNCWAFVDGTTRAICRPTGNQKEYYSGHKRVHCIKYQSVVTPDGLIVSLLGAYQGRRHDAFIFRESGLYEQLEEKVVFGADSYVIYGDQAYGIRRLLLCPYPGRGLNAAQQNFNRTMSTVRQAVEWGFQKIVAEFAFVDFKKNQKLQLQEIEMYYISAAILTNCHTCLYGSETAQYFNIEPIGLDLYLN